MVDSINEELDDFSKLLEGVEINPADPEVERHFSNAIVASTRDFFTPELVEETKDKEKSREIDNFVDKKIGQMNNEIATLAAHMRLWRVVYHLLRIAPKVKKTDLKKWYSSYYKTNENFDDVYIRLLERDLITVDRRSCFVQVHTASLRDHSGHACDPKCTIPKMYLN